MAIRYLNKGISLKAKGLHAEALEHFKKAEEYSWEASSPALLATVVHNLGELWDIAGDKNEAFEQYFYAVEKLEKLVEVTPSFKEQLAITLSKFASMLVDRGEKEEGKATYEKAISLYRELRREHPRSVQIRYNMISTLNNLGALLADMNKRDEALWKFEKALKMLDEKQCPAENYTNCSEKKAIVLENLANLLVEMGELEEANKKFESALNIYFMLIDQGHTTEFYQSKIASLLRKTANLFLSQDRKEEALQSYTSLLQIYTELSERQKKNKEFLIEKVSVLTSMGNLLERMQNIYGAVSKYEEALGILKDIQTLQETSDYSPMLIDLELKLGKIFILQNKVKEGLEKIQEGIGHISVYSAEKKTIDQAYSSLIQICEELSEKSDYVNSDVFLRLLEVHNELSKVMITPAGLLSIAKIKGIIGRIQLDSENKVAAIRELLQAVDVYVQLKDKSVYASEIARLLDMIEANIYYVTEAKDFEEVYYKITSVRKEHEIESTANNRSFMYIKERLADLALDKGSYEQAFDQYMEIYSIDSSMDRVIKKAADLLEKFETYIHSNTTSENILDKMKFLIKGYTVLSDIEPSNPLYRRHLAVIEQDMGKALLDYGQSAEARISLEQALENYMALINMLPGNRHYLKDMYAVLKYLTALLPTINDDEKELKCQEKISQSYSLMCELDPQDVGLLEDLANSLDHQASLLASLERKKEAYDVLNQVLDKYELLYQLEESSKHAAKAAVTMNNMGALLARMGQQAEAKQMFEDALRIYNYLLDQEPDNIEHMVHAACTLDNMGTLFGNIDRLEDAKHMYQAALQMYMDITSINPDDTSYNKYAAFTMENLGDVLERMGRHDDARWMHDNAKKLKTGEA